MQNSNEIGPVQVRIEYIYPELPIPARVTISKYEASNLPCAISKAQYICGNLLQDDELIPYIDGKKYQTKVMRAPIGQNSPTYMIAYFKYPKIRKINGRIY